MSVAPWHVFLLILLSLWQWNPFLRRDLAPSEEGIMAPRCQNRAYHVLPAPLTVRGKIADVAIIDWSRDWRKCAISLALIYQQGTDVYHRHGGGMTALAMAVCTVPLDFVKDLGRSCSIRAIK